MMPPSGDLVAFLATLPTLDKTQYDQLVASSDGHSTPLPKGTARTPTAMATGHRHCQESLPPLTTTIGHRH